MNALRGLLVGSAALGLGACSGSSALDARDVYAIIDEVDVAVRAEALVEPTVLLAASAAANASSPEDAAKTLADELTGAPCVDAARDGATVAVVYSGGRWGCGSGVGILEATLSGEETISFLEANGQTTTIDHAWKGLTDGYLTVDGTAHVTTAATAYGASEHVVNALSWVRGSDGKSGHGKDDRTTPVASSLGRELPPPTGLRTWESDAGSWALRPIDARLQPTSTGIPFIGTFALVTPDERALTLSFISDSNGARLTLSDGTQSFSLGISPNGTPTE